MFLNKERGSGILIASIIGISLSAMVMLGLSKVNEANFKALKKTYDIEHAKQYALERADILRSTNFNDLEPMSKTAIGVSNSKDINDETFYEEVVDNSEGDNFEKIYRVNIYKGNNEKTLFSVLVKRIPSNINVISSITGDLENVSDNGSLTVTASKELLNKKIQANMNSYSHNSSISSKNFKEYLNNLLLLYQRKDTGVMQAEAGKVIGSEFNPIYVDSNGFAKQTKLYFRLNRNDYQPNIGMIEVGKDGTYYFDYVGKSMLFESIK